jgi:hypothetical protein
MSYHAVSYEVLTCPLISMSFLSGVGLHLYISDSVSFPYTFFARIDNLFLNIHSNVLFSLVETHRFMISNRNINQIAIFQILQVPRFMPMMMQCLLQHPN